MPNFVGEVGARYKAYEPSTNDPNTYRFTGTFERSLSQEDELEHVFNNVITASGEHMTRKTIYDTAVGSLYVLVKCGEGECLTGGRRRRTRRRRTRHKSTRRRR